MAHKDRKLGTITRTRGLRRLVEMRATEAMARASYPEHRQLPPKIAPLLGGWQSSEEL